MQAEQQLARAKQAAKCFGISESTLWAWASSKPGFPQPLRCGAKTSLWDLAEIRKYLEHQKAGTKSEFAKQALNLGRDKFNAAKRATAQREGRRADAAVSA